MGSPAKKYLLWIIVVFLSFVLISAARFGAAELFSLNALHSIESWKSAKLPPSAMQIESVARQFETARFFADGNPDHHENIARMHLLRAALPDVSSAAKGMQLSLGLAEIRTAIAQRPVSPYSWTILLLLKRELGEFDAEFRFALHRAVELGPWEPELLTSLADIGLSAWDALPAAEQAIIQQVFVRGMERQDKLMRDVAQAHHNPCAESEVSCQ
ncbi:MAG: hypothetical protein Q7T25_07860 [Sideroxyarcus sp.]|nr:hypothetical protein [Sideroxyarcus sp.]